MLRKRRLLLSVGAGTLSAFALGPACGSSAAPGGSPDAGDDSSHVAVGSVPQMIDGGEDAGEGGGDAAPIIATGSLPFPGDAGIGD